MRASLCIALVALLLLPGCHRGVRTARPAKSKPQLVAPVLPALPEDVLIVHEEDQSEEARDLASLLAHFDHRAVVLPTKSYPAGKADRYPRVFYLAGESGEDQRAAVAAELAGHSGLIVWAGPGVTALGNAALGKLGLKDSTDSAEADWSLTYRGQTHRERLRLPLVTAERAAHELARADCSEGRTPFLAGSGHLWYAAAGPRISRDRFWSSCLWADALHDMLGVKGHEGRTLIAALRGLPVWASASQAPGAAGPILRAGIPVTLFASVRNGSVALADRPEAVAGLRRAEGMGATLTLSVDTDLAPREQLHLAWELGLHPVAWQGAEGDANPFRLRIASPEASPPFSAGGLLPAPIVISDAGYVGDDDLARLEMQGVVRDAVAVLSFGLWVTPRRFTQFLQRREANGWRVRDLRELGAQVADTRRIVTGAPLALPFPHAGFAVAHYDHTWRRTEVEAPPDAEGKVTLTPPKGGVAVLEPSTAREAGSLLTAVTLDPWAYTRAGMSSKTLATALADRYHQNGVNAVFFYAYNVEAGAAYRTRYPGASRSDWAEDDLLGNLLTACHARDIKVIAWMYSGRDKGMWKQHADWRERTVDGKDYNPLRLHAAYFLCPRNEEVRAWYAGLLHDLAARYPTLDGVELCEPLVNWYGNTACYCDACRKGFAKAHRDAELGGREWRRYRADGLTEFLSGCIKGVAEQGIDTYVMTICDALDNGAVLTPRRQWEESGLDLDALLSGPHPPDWVNFEVIWQQWAMVSKRGVEVFNPAWAASTAQRLSQRVDGRAKVVIHVELTNFGLQLMTPEKLVDTLHQVETAHPNGVEVYHSGSIDRESAWPQLSRAYQELRP